MIYNLLEANNPNNLTDLVILIFLKLLVKDCNKEIII